MTDSVAGPADVARMFLHAVAWAEHTRMWEMLSALARTAVLEVAENRGMDPLLGARLRESTARDDERDHFLADLLHGIRADLSGVDLDTVRCVSDDDLDDGEQRISTTVRLVQDVPAALGGPVPVGWVELSADPHGRWSVVRVGGIT